MLKSMNQSKNIKTSKITQKPTLTTPPTFIDGVLYAAQVIALESKEPGLAGDIFRDSGYTQAALLKAQRKNGYRSREMCRYIREAFRK